MQDIGEGLVVSVEVQAFPNKVFQGTVACVGDVAAPHHSDNEGTM
jgi:hypothetical protein